MAGRRARGGGPKSHSFFRAPPPKVLVSLAFIAGLGRAGVMDFGGRPTLAHARSVFWLAFFWMAYVQSGVIALRYLTVPMYR